MSSSAGWGKYSFGQTAMIDLNIKIIAARCLTKEIRSNEGHKWLFFQMNNDSTGWLLFS